LCVEQEYPDFLSSKSVIEKPMAREEDPSQETRTQPKTDFQASAKLRASEYRKEQYQKRKLRMKTSKRGPGAAREVSQKRRSYSAEIEASLFYFSANGFPMPEGPSEAIVGEAKRKLSRVFHPDKGGTTEEVVELNQNCERLLRFLQS
jgi:hypothetical protein